MARRDVIGILIDVTIHFNIALNSVFKWTQTLKKHILMDVLLKLSSSEVFVKNLHDSSYSVYFSVCSVEF